MKLNKSPEFIKRIEKALDQIRPYLETDGGNVSVVEITDTMVLRLRFDGACRSCKMSEMTLKGGVEESILRAIPEIKSVEAVNTTREDAFS